MKLLGVVFVVSSDIHYLIVYFAANYCVYFRFFPVAWQQFDVCHFRLDHPELGQMAAGLGLFGLEGRSETVYPAVTHRCRFQVKQAGLCQVKQASEVSFTSFGAIKKSLCFRDRFVIILERSGLMTRLNWVICYIWKF